MGLGWLGLGLGSRVAAGDPVQKLHVWFFGSSVALGRCQYGVTIYRVYRPLECDCVWSMGHGNSYTP